VAEYDHLSLTWHIALTTVYALTFYTVIQTLLSGGTHWYVRSLSNIACEGHSNAL